MKVIETSLNGVLIFEPKVFGDTRGFFKETYNLRAFQEAGLDVEFVQDNVSVSTKGVVRGLHYQHPHGQGKLVQVLEGEVYDVAVDIRVGSDMFAAWVGEVLSAENHRQMYIPPGFAHGFCVTSERAVFAYKCTDYYNASCEGGIIYNDPDLGIDWPVENPILSEKDAKYPQLSDIPRGRVPELKGLL